MLLYKYAAVSYLIQLLLVMPEASLRIQLYHLHTMNNYKNHFLLPGYHSVNQEVKVPAGWLIEQCGWKGKRIGDVGVHTQQALVLVNYAHGSGKEIFSLASNIISSVKEKFNIALICEVNIK
jgi:UDP-N-acetylmuramate dehydrogenase